MNQMGGKLMLDVFCAAEFVEVAKTIFASQVDGFEMNGSISAGTYLAASENIHRKVHGDGAGMKEIQRPQIECATRQIDPACGVSDDGVGLIQFSVKNWAMLRNFL